MDRDVVVLKASRKTTVYAALAAAYCGGGAAVTAMRDPSAWQEYGLLAVLSAGFVFLLARMVRRRNLHQLEITESSISGAERTITRKEISSIRRYGELMFKGVRIDLLDGAWVGIRCEHHEPVGLLRVLSDYGYPVAEGGAVRPNNEMQLTKRGES